MELTAGVVSDVSRAERRAGLEMVVGKDASMLAAVILFSPRLSSVAGQVHSTTALHSRSRVPFAQLGRFTRTVRKSPRLDAQIPTMAPRHVVDDQNRLSALRHLLHRRQQLHSGPRDVSAVMRREVDTDGRVGGLDLAQVLQQAGRVGILAERCLAGREGKRVFNLERSVEVETEKHTKRVGVRRKNRDWGRVSVLLKGGLGRRREVVG